MGHRFTWHGPRLGTNFDFHGEIQGHRFFPDKPSHCYHCSEDMPQSHAHILTICDRYRLRFSSLGNLTAEKRITSFSRPFCRKTRSHSHSKTYPLIPHAPSLVLTPLATSCTPIAMLLPCATIYMPAHLHTNLPEVSLPSCK